MHYLHMSWGARELNFIIFALVVAVAALWLMGAFSPVDHFMYEMPWWNNTRFTRNQSYDLRGDPPVAYYPWISPWGVSSWAL